MWGIVTDIVRSFHKMLHGKISPNLNIAYLGIGYVMVLALPLIGIFDTYGYRKIHETIAITFFGSCSIYMTLVGNALYKNLDSFTPAKQRAIRIAKKATIGLYLTVGGMLIC